MSVWDMIKAAGVEADVHEAPDGVVTVFSTDGESKVTFGESEPVEPGQEREGWDWTAYRLDDDMWVTAGGDWAQTDADMSAALKHYLA